MNRLLQLLLLVMSHNFSWMKELETIALPSTSSSSKYAQYVTSPTLV